MMMMAESNIGFQTTATHSSNSAQFDKLETILKEGNIFFLVETNNELESSEKEIEEKKIKIEEMLHEVGELREQVKRKAEEREELFTKRKRLNDECNVLQKKLHCCDSLLKVVPKVDSDTSNS